MAQAGAAYARGLRRGLPSRCPFLAPGAVEIRTEFASLWTRPGRYLMVMGRESREGAADIQRSHDEE